MLNQNMTPRGTQGTGLAVMIGRYSPNSQHEMLRRYPANVGCCFFSRAEMINMRYKHKIWTRKDKKLALHCHFGRNPTQRESRKRMIEIWQE